jgi:hypothetical protein
MNNSKKIKRCIKTLETIYEYLEYYMVEIPKDLKKDYQELHSNLNDLGLEKKKDHVRLIKKIKSLDKLKSKIKEVSSDA